MIKKKNIYIIGNILGAYRSQEILTVLLNSTKYTINFHNFSVSNKSNGVLHKLLKAIDVFISTLFRLYFLIRADIVLVLPMNNNKFFQILTAKLFRKKIISDFYISYYDTRIIDRKWASEKSFMAFVYRMYDMLLLSADKVFFLNQSEADFYTKTVKKKSKNVVGTAILPLCVVKRPRANLNFFNKNTNSINICWWGTFIPLHGLEKIIETAKILKENNIEFKLHLFGNSKENGLPFQKMIEEKKLIKNVFLYHDYTFLNGRLENFLIENCDIALGAFGDSIKAKTVITNKVIDALSMKIPVMTCYSKGIEEYFENNIDLFLSSNSPKEMAAVLMKIISSPKSTIINLIESASEKFDTNFSLDAFKRKFLKELEII